MDDLGLKHTDKEFVLHPDNEVRWADLHHPWAPAGICIKCGEDARDDRYHFWFSVIATHAAHDKHAAAYERFIHYRRRDLMNIGTAGMLAKVFLGAELFPDPDPED